MGSLHPRLGRKRGHTHSRNPRAGSGSQEMGPEVPLQALAQPSCLPGPASCGFLLGFCRTAGPAHTLNPARLEAPEPRDSYQLMPGPFSRTT